MKLSFPSSGIGLLAAIFKLKEAWGNGWNTRAVLEIERNVGIRNKVVALLFSFPLLSSLLPPNYINLWNTQGNNILFSVPVFKCYMSETLFKVFNANQLSEQIVQFWTLLRKSVVGHIIACSASQCYCFSERHPARSSKSVRKQNPWFYKGVPVVPQAGGQLRDGGAQEQLHVPHRPSRAAEPLRDPTHPRKPCKTSYLPLEQLGSRKPLNSKAPT